MGDDWFVIARHHRLPAKAKAILALATVRDEPMPDHVNVTLARVATDNVSAAVGEIGVIYGPEGKRPAGSGRSQPSLSISSGGTPCQLPSFSAICQ